MKYIDADILRKEIERAKEYWIQYRKNETAVSEWNAGYDEGMASSYDNFLYLIDSLQQEQEMDLEKEITAYFKDWYVDESDQGYSLKTPTGSAVMGHMKNVARHFAQWGAEHGGSSKTPKEDKLRYCVDYINPCFPLLDNGGLNVRHLRVPDEHWAEMAITLILSFGGKIYALYRGNVQDGKLADWPTPMIVESKDWFTDEWLHELMDCGHNCL